jgi:hypothetical protein
MFNLSGLLDRINTLELPVQGMNMELDKAVRK